ncbi:MAG: response regulator [Rhodospirillales bacterium]|nr:response regulator [Rhodospirillales bacterium]
MADYNIEKLKFLVVDDDQNMRHLVSTILNSLGSREVEAASTAEAGFAKLAEFEADVVICDLRMEPLDGIELTKMLRDQVESPNCYIPIIMLTGHAEKATVEVARDAGVHEFLAKPVSATKLYAKIKNIIERPRAFVRTKDYFGPDRRRRQDPDYKGPERRKDK